MALGLCFGREDLDSPSLTKRTARGIAPSLSPSGYPFLSDFQLAQNISYKLPDTEDAIHARVNYANLPHASKESENTRIVLLRDGERPSVPQIRLEPLDP